MIILIIYTWQGAFRLTKRHKYIRNIAVITTLLVIVGLSIYDRKVSEMKRQLDEEIAQEQMQLEEKNKVLKELQMQYEQMDSEEYIRTVAMEQLGMVDKDTIVFYIKD